MSVPDLDPADSGYDATSPSHPSGPRPGTQPSAPSASHYMPELPYAEELQALLEGKYIVESFLGQGGMGAVYKGLQMPLKRPVAIKILAKQQAGAQDDFDFEERFKREAYAMAALTHPNIVQVYDCGDAGEHWLFISMELVDGGDLSDAIKNGLVTPEAALGLIGPICDGLQAAHDRGLVHRDIKPANIFLTADGKPKVADFGLAKKFDVKDTLVTKTGMGMGTPDYAAPEQYEGIPDIDHRADIYALGVMFYQMLTGSLPRGAYKAPSLRVPVDPRIDDVVSRAMEQDRNERYQSAAELKTEVQQILATWMAAPKTAPATTAAAARPAGQARGSTQAPLRTGPVQHRAAGQYQQAPPEKSGGGMLAIAFFAIVVIGVGAFFVLRKPEPVPATASAPAPADTMTPTISSPEDRKPAQETPMPAAPGDSSLSPTITALPVQAPSKSAQGFSSFAPGAVWRDGFAPSETWGQNWKRVSSEMHIEGTKSGFIRFSQRSKDAGLRARFRAQKPGKFFDLILRFQEESPGGPRYVVTVWSNEKLRGGIDIIPPRGQGTRHYIERFDTAMPVGTGGEHTAELYMRGDQLTLFFDGVQVATARDSVLKDGNPALLCGEGMEVISVETCVLDGTPAIAGQAPSPALGSAPQATSASMVPSAPAPSSSAPPTSSRADLRETDLLARLDLAKHVIPFDAQEWRKGGNGLEVANPQNPNSTKGTVELPAAVAKSYAVEATFKTRNINGEFGFVLPLGDGAQVACHILSARDGWAGLDLVDGKQAHDPGMDGFASPFKVPSQEPVTMRAEVRRSVGELDIKFLINGKVMGTYKGQSGRLALHRSWKVGENKDSIYLACRHNAGGFQTTFSKVTYQPLDLVAEVAAGDPRLAQLDSGFRARYEADAEKPFAAGLASLTQSYMENGISRARAAAQAKGDLNEVTALDAEKARLEKGERLPTDDAPDTPAALKGLRAAFRGAVAKLENERAKVAVPIFDIYLKALDAHATELMRSNKVDEAQKIRLVRAEVAEQKAKLLPDFSSSRNAPAGRPSR